MEEMRERDKRFPRESLFVSVFSFPENLGGAENLTVKSILWRGSAYRFPSLSVHSNQKKMEEEGQMHSYRRKRGRLAETWLMALLAATENGFVLLYLS
jgi:hypothetical protein